MTLVFRCHDPTHVAHIAAAINSGIAVNDFTPFAGFGKSDPISLPRNGSQVENDRDRLFAFGILANERKDTGFAVRRVDPIKAVVIVIVFPQ